MSGIKAGSGVNDGASTEGWLDELRSAYLYRASGLIAITPGNCRRLCRMCARVWWRR
jgi:hypothetical protein